MLYGVKGISFLTENTIEKIPESKTVKFHADSERKSKGPPRDVTLHHEMGDSVDLGGSFNTAYRDTVPCFMVHCCIVWID